MSKESNEMGMFAAIAALKKENPVLQGNPEVKTVVKPEVKTVAREEKEETKAVSNETTPTTPKTEATVSEEQEANYTIGVLKKKNKDTRKIRKGFYLSEKAGKNLFLASEGIGISENELINQLLESLNLS